MVLLYVFLLPGNGIPQKLKHVNAAAKNLSEPQLVTASTGVVC